MADNVNVHVFSEIESNGKSARIRVRVIIRNLGSPVELEKRAVTGVESLVMCGARVSEAASGEGVNVPVSMTPLACAGRKPGCCPKIASNWFSRSWLSAISFWSEGSGMGCWSYFKLWQ
jgi:hypothetical protein